MRMYAKIENASYWYEVDGEGEPVVLLHGFTGSTATWKDLAESLAVAYQVIRIDLPGHGRTKTPGGRSMDACIRDLKGLLESIGVDCFHLVGYSMGGRTALSFAANYPEMVETLVLESASPGLEDAEARRQRIIQDEKLAARIEQEGIPAFVDFWQDIPLFHTQKKLFPKRQEEIRRERLSQSPEGLAQSLRKVGTGSQPPMWSSLSRLDMPVLLLVGELDGKFVEINKKMQNELKTGKLIICEDAGHAIHVEKPELFDRMVMEFLKQST